MENPTYAPQYLAGIRYFNERDFFESHEVWEDVWNDCDSGSRKFYQGLIQIAAGFPHWTVTRRPRGVQILLAAGVGQTGLGALQFQQ
ncbi:MAG: DUF309 domain-containing protein [Acidobacteria bacterium]|nr:DUF309 domain-containing protein [Acidobacteriota bacterium]